MIHVSEIPDTILGRLSGMYTHACFSCGIVPNDVTTRNESKIRRFLTKYYSDEIRELPEEMAALFAKPVKDGELQSFLIACSQQMILHRRKLEQEFEAITQPLGREIQMALKDLQALEYAPAVRQGELGVEILLEDCDAYRRWLHLSDAQGFPGHRKDDFMSAGELTFSRESGLFCFHYQLENSEDDAVVPVELFFSGAAVSYEVYDCTGAMSMGDNPWERLCAVASQLYIRSQLPGYICNPAETELLPLCAEIAALDLWAQFDEPFSMEFSCLKAQLKGKTLKLLQRLEKENFRTERYMSLARKLRTALCRKEYEPMWRSCFENIRASQKEYPKKPEAICEPERLENTRAAITRLLRQHGYTGAYPDFVKRDALKGIRLEESYDQTYWICNEKRVEYRIQCLESCGEGGSLAVELLGGTAFLKPGEELVDAFSCLFDAKGRRLYHSVHYDATVDGDEQSDDLEQCVAIAVKKTQLQKLTKQEKKYYYGATIPGWGLFWSFLLIVGGMFGILFTLGMVLFVALMALMIEGPDVVGPLLAAVPWGYCLAFAWVGFGGSMGLITVLAKRK